MRCILCGSNFNIFKEGSGGHNREICYNCVPHASTRRERNKLRYKAIHDYMNRLKLQRGCDICGYNKCAKALEYHHRDPKEKDINVSNMMGITDLKRALIEIEKCDLLCANCHREEHERLDSFH